MRDDAHDLEMTLPTCFFLALENREVALSLELAVEKSSFGEFGLHADEKSTCVDSVQALFLTVMSDRKIKVVDSMVHYISCNYCGGSSKIPLPRHLEKTLRVLMRKECTSEDVRRAVGKGVTRNAMNNRLEDLRMYGFVQRTKRGKEWVYRYATETIKTDAAA